MKNILINTTLILGLSLFAQNILHAQAPGYIGKRFSGTYVLKAGSMPDWEAGLRYSHVAQFGYVISRKTSLQLSADMNQTKHDSRFLAGLRVSGDPIAFYSSSTSFNELLVSSTVFGFDALFTLGRHIAPRGTFLNLGISSGTARVQEPFIVPFRTDPSDSESVEERVIQADPILITQVRIGINHRKLIGQSGLFVVGGIAFEYVVSSDFIVGKDFYKFPVKAESIHNAAIGGILRSINPYNANLGLGMIF